MLKKAKQKTHKVQLSQRLRGSTANAVGPRVFIGSDGVCVSVGDSACSRSISYSSAPGNASKIVLVTVLYGPAGDLDDYWRGTEAGDGEYGYIKSGARMVS